jgi:hypothetical protein
MIAGVGFEPNHVWAPCCKTWQKFEIETLHCRKKGKVKKECSGRECPLSWAPCCKTWLKKWKVNLRWLRKKNEVRDFYLLGSYPLVGHHVVNEL